MDESTVKIELNMKQMHNYRNNTKSQMTREPYNDLVPKVLKESNSVVHSSKYVRNDNPKKAMSSHK